MNKSEIAERAAREEELFKAKELAVLKNDEVKQLREFLRELRTDILCGTGLRTMTDVELKAVRSVERAIAESQAPQPTHRHEWTGSQWDDQMYCECGAIKLEDGSIKCMGDGEPSPPLTEAKELFELYLGVSKSSDVNTYVDWYKRVNDWLKRNSGAAQEVSPHHYISTACLHGQHEKCRRFCKYCEVPCACKNCAHVEEVSPPSPEPCLDCAANDRDWAQIAQELGCESTREEMLKKIRKLGDTRELKAALHKLRPFAYKAESVDCYRCRECHAQSSELSKIVHDADCEVGEVERMLGDEGL